MGDAGAAGSATSSLTFRRHREHDRELNSGRRSTALGGAGGNGYGERRARRAPATATGVLTGARDVARMPSPRAAPAAANPRPAATPAVVKAEPPLRAPRRRLDDERIRRNQLHRQARPAETAAQGTGLAGRAARRRRRQAIANAGGPAAPGLPLQRRLVGGGGVGTSGARWPAPAHRRP